MTSPEQHEHIARMAMIEAIPRAVDVAELDALLGRLGVSYRQIAYAGNEAVGPILAAHEDDLAWDPDRAAGGAALGAFLAGFALGAGLADPEGRRP